MIDRNEVWGSLRSLLYPGVPIDIVSLQLVSDIIVEGHTVVVFLSQPDNRFPLVPSLLGKIKDSIGALPAVRRVEVLKTGRRPEGVKHLVALAGGKGGVGKSTLTVNLALALSQQGYAVGVLDTDLDTPNIPLLLGGKSDDLREPHNVFWSLYNDPATSNARKTKPAQIYGVKFVSLGLYISDRTPIKIDSLVVTTSIIQRFLFGVEWNVDYLIIDLPAGTGKSHLALTESVDLSGVIFVTTPQRVAVLDTIRAMEYYRQSYTRVIGVVENMATFECPHCHTLIDIFPTHSHNYGQLSGHESPVIGTIPFDPRLAQLADDGKPLLLSLPNSEIAQCFSGIAKRVAQRLQELP